MDCTCKEGRASSQGTLDPQSRLERSPAVPLSYPTPHFHLIFCLCCGDPNSFSIGHGKPCFSLPATASEEARCAHPLGEGVAPVMCASPLCQVESESQPTPYKDKQTPSTRVHIVTHRLHQVRKTALPSLREDVQKDQAP